MNAQRFLIERVAHVNLLNLLRAVQPMMDDIVQSQESVSLFCHYFMGLLVPALPSRYSCVLVPILLYLQEYQICYDFLRPPSASDDYDSNEDDDPPEYPITEEQFLQGFRSSIIVHDDLVKGILHHIYGLVHPGWRLQANSDIFESVSLFAGAHLTLCDLVCLTFLKVKALQSLKMLQQHADDIKDMSVSNPEVVPRIQAHMTDFYFLHVFCNSDGNLERDDHTSDIRRLQDQIDYLIMEVHRHNDQFWNHLTLGSRPDDFDETRFALEMTKIAWDSAPEILEYVSIAFSNRY